MPASFGVIILTAVPEGLAMDPGGAFIKVDGREVLLRSIELFLNRDNVKHIQAVFLPENIDEVKRKHAAHLGFSGVKVTTGGPGWGDQLRASLEKLPDSITHVVVHDAARPAVPYGDIDRLLESAEQHSIVCLCAPIRSTLLELDDHGTPRTLAPAARYAQLLTPQAFARDRFIELARSGSVPPAHEMELVKGSALNVRCNGAGDASLIKAMLNMLPKPKPKGPLNPFEEAQW